MHDDALNFTPIVNVALLLVNVICHRTMIDNCICVAVCSSPVGKGELCVYSLRHLGALYSEQSSSHSSSR